MTKDLLNLVLNQLIYASGLITLILFIWQGALIARDNKKQLKWPFNRKRFKIKPERFEAMLRCALGFLIVSISFLLTSTILELNVTFGTQAGVIEYYFSTLEFSDSAPSIWSMLFGTEYGFTGMIGTVGFVLSGLLITLSSVWKRIRYTGDLLFWLSVLYVGGRTLQVAFAAGANGAQFLSDASYAWLGLYGLLFFVLVFVFSVKGLLAYDQKKLKGVKLRLEQMLQLCLGLLFLMLGQGLMSTLSYTATVPESFSCLMLDSEFAVFRYALILYLFGGGVFLRQIFPYFRILLMGLLSLTGAYFVFDVINWMI